MMIKPFLVSLQLLHCIVVLFVVTLARDGLSLPVLSLTANIIPTLIIVGLAGMRFVGARSMSVRVAIALVTTIYLAVSGLSFAQTARYGNLDKKQRAAVAKLDDKAWRFSIATMTAFAMGVTLLLGFNMDKAAASVSARMALAAGVCALAAGVAAPVMYVYAHRLTDAQIKARLIPAKQLVEGIKALEADVKSDSVKVAVPDGLASFDVRKKWPNSVTGVRQQGSCGSCLLFASTSMLADRWSIKKGTPPQLLSVQRVIECYNKQTGFDVCSQGSAVATVMTMLMKSDFVAPESCSPYTYAMSLLVSRSHDRLFVTFAKAMVPVLSVLAVLTVTRIVAGAAGGLSPPLERGLNSAIVLSVASVGVLSIVMGILWDKSEKKPTEKFAATSPCGSTCVDGSPIPTGQPSFAAGWTQLTNVNSIKEQLYNGGTVGCAIMVYDDFPRGPIVSTTPYRHASTAMLGGHAMTIVGWGPDYWIIRNSWGSDWGLVADRGHYYHAFGDGVEDACYAGDV